MSNGRRPWKVEIYWLFGLIAFFFLTYNFANWAASVRQHVPSLVFAWEYRAIPFLPWTIVPYWTLDGFYVLSFFLCRSRTELDRHGKRILAAQIISVACFLMYPLRFSFTPPHTSGLFGWLFHALGTFDRPFNQAPSLHLSLATIVWVKLSDHSHGPVRFLIRCWLVLIGISTLTTYQHHVIDIPAGICVGLLSIALFPDHRESAPSSERSIRLAAIYFGAGTVFAALGFSLGGWAGLLFWPATALWIVAIVYAMGSPEVFQEDNNRMRAALMALLAPFLIARRAHARWGTRREPVAHEIADGVWLGRLPLRGERDHLHIASLLNLAAELPANTSGVVARAVPMLDLVAPTVEQLEAAVTAIDDLETSRPTLVCCAMGYSRSAASVAAWLVATEIAPSVDAAIAIIRKRRPAVVLTVHHRQQLEKWARSTTHRDRSVKRHAP